MKSIIITEIHRYDAYYQRRHEFIGKAFTIHASPIVSLIDNHYRSAGYYSAFLYNEKGIPYYFIGFKFRNSNLQIKVI